MTDLELLLESLNIQKDAVILVVGNLDSLDDDLQELCKLGFNAYGYEINGETKDGVRTVVPDADDYYSWIFWTDLSLATFNQEDFASVIAKMVYLAQVGIHVVVPLADCSNTHYLDTDLEMGKKMSVRLCFEDWIRMFQDATTDFVVSGSTYFPTQKERFGKYGYITFRRTLI